MVPVRVTPIRTGAVLIGCRIHKYLSKSGAGTENAACGCGCYESRENHHFLQKVLSQSLNLDPYSRVKAIALERLLPAGPPVGSEYQNWKHQVLPAVNLPETVGSPKSRS